MESFSQIGQDLLVLKYFKHKKNGTFVDIGCGYPSYINNTFILEKNYFWQGLSVDLMDYKEPINSVYQNETWSTLRPNSKRILSDALELDYAKIFSEQNLPTTIDLISLDLEPPSITLECLFKIPFDKYIFNMIIFETDEYRENGTERVEISRKYLESLNYIFMENLNRQDDIYLHKSFFEKL